jgi:hypothetical protein
MTQERILKYIATQYKNIKFIKERIEIQNQPNYNPYRLIGGVSSTVWEWNQRLYTRVQVTRKTSVTEVKDIQYSEMDITLCKERIALAEKKLEMFN